MILLFRDVRKQLDHLPTRPGPDRFNGTSIEMMAAFKADKIFNDARMDFGRI